MDMFGTLIALVLAIPVLAVISIVMTMNTRERLKRLEFRIAGLEGRLSGEAPSPKPVPAALPEVVPEAAEAPKAEAEDETPPPPETSAAPAAPAAPAKPTISLEERFGTQWVVWAGGIALALGGFFLVRQAIEQGWFGELQRVLLGAAVALHGIEEGCGLRPLCGRARHHGTGSQAAKVLVRLV